jgi:hypothetical protein
VNYTNGRIGQLADNIYFFLNGYFPCKGRWMY